jgi:cell wall assembly regulator SMI1
MSSIVWEEYLDIPPAKDEEIREAEQQLGMTFPEEFKHILKSFQGKTPIPNGIESEEVCKVTFGPILHVLQSEEPVYSIKRAKELWDRYYPNLLPIANSGDGCIFAYDFSSGEENPPVVFVNAEADPEDEDEDEGILFVASSLTELLSNLKD